MYNLRSGDTKQKLHMHHSQRETAATPIWATLKNTTRFKSSEVTHLSSKQLLRLEKKKKKISSVTTDLVNRNKTLHLFRKLINAVSIALLLVGLRGHSTQTVLSTKVVG